MGRLSLSIGNSFAMRAFAPLDFPYAYRPGQKKLALDVYRSIHIGKPFIRYRREDLSTSGLLWGKEGSPLLDSQERHKKRLRTAFTF